MNKIFLYLFEPFNNLCKWLYITLITILFLSSFFFFISIFSNVINTKELTLSLRNNETYLSYWQMHISEPVENILSNQPRMYEELNNLNQNDKDEKRRIEKETDRFMCDLYNMQNDDFILEYCSFMSPRVSGFPKLSDSSFIHADQSFFEHEYLPIIEGREITEKDFEEIRNSKSPDMIINVIAGYSYSKYYKIGDILVRTKTDYYEEDEDLSDYTLRLGDQEKASYRIVGFIEEGTTFSNFSGSIHKADNKIFIPHIPEISIYFPEIAENGKYNVTSDAATNWKILIRNGKVDEYAEKINQMLDGLFIDKYCDLMDSYNQAYEILDEVVSARKDSFLIIAIILFLFSVSGIVVSTVNKFKRNTKSYTIHMTVGATNKDIYIFAAVEMLMQILIAFAIIHIPYIFSWVELPIIKFINRNIPYMRSPVMYILLFAFAVIFVAVTVGVTAYCLKKYSLAEAIKGKE